MLKTKNIKTLTVEYLGDFLNTVFPRCCSVCQNVLLKHEKYICFPCLYRLPKTHYHTMDKNNLLEKFYGIFPIHHAAALFFYKSESDFHNIIHQFKYKGNKQMAQYMGNYYGKILKKSIFSEHDLLIPVPLHKKRQKYRGYNQSEELCNGLSEELNIPINTNAVQRIIHTKTQTRKSKGDRMDNVENIFSVAQPELLKNKSIILVDDVITTGSTIASCAATIYKATECKISILSLAVAT